MKRKIQVSLALAIGGAFLIYMGSTLNTQAWVLNTGLIMEVFGLPLFLSTSWRYLTD